jgi:transglutaminase-like putative cysteine protease
MTAANTPVPAASAPTRRDRTSMRLPFEPSEGWLTVGLLLLLCLSLAWSLDGARLILGRDGDTDFLPWIAVIGAAFGIFGAKVGWGRARTYLVGSLGAALITPIIVGMVLLPEGGSPLELFRATADATVNAFYDLVLQDQATTVETGHHLWVLGLLMWATAMYAAYACFHHHRPLNAILVVGLLLVANVAMTLFPQLVYLVIFSLAALFLLIRFHTLEEQADWLRRRIGDPSAISGLYLRGGTIFIVGAVTGSLLLTMVASSAPLAGMWTGMSGRLIEWTRAIERFLPASGNAPSLGPSFGSEAVVRGFWSSNDAPALTIALNPTLTDVPYWAAVVYDTYAMDSWQTSDTRTIERAEGEGLLLDTGDAVDPAARQPLTVTITPATPTSIVFTPFAPSAVDTAVDVKVVGEEGYLASITRDASSEPYTITSDLAVMSDAVDGGITENRLRVAGTDYPAEIVERYTALPPDALGPAAVALRDAIVDDANSDLPYDIAATAVGYFQDPANFTYSIDVRDRANRAGCAELGVAECFAVIREGYCEYYAFTMAVLLRDLGIPTRVVEGYQRGELDAEAGVRRVKQSDAHAWVQVYFPNYGWVDFDPTGGGEAELSPIPSGRPESSLAPGPSALPSQIPARSAITDGEEGTPAGGINPGPRGDATGPLIAVTLLLAIVVGVIATMAFRRGPRGPVSADGAYSSVTRLATRLGFGPRPNQTVYEYVGGLAEAMPGSRPELETVARAKVEVAYGGRVLGEARLHSLREAQRRLRLGLLAFGVRRLRPGRRR